MERSQSRFHTSIPCPKKSPCQLTSSTFTVCIFDIHEFLRLRCRYPRERSQSRCVRDSRGNSSRIPRPEKHPCLATSTPSQAAVIQKQTRTDQVVRQIEDEWVVCKCSVNKKFGPNYILDISCGLPHEVRMVCNLAKIALSIVYSAEERGIGQGRLTLYAACSSGSKKQICKHFGWPLSQKLDACIGPNRLYNWPCILKAAGPFLYTVASFSCKDAIAIPELKYRIRFRKCLCLDYCPVKYEYN